MNPRLGLLAAVAVFAAPGLAQAQAATYNVRAQPLQAALIDFALQAGVSIDASAAAACRPSSGLAGRFSTRQALTRLLEGTGCSYRMIDARSVLIVRNPVQAPPTPTTTPEASRPALEAPLSPTTVDVLVVTSPKRTVGLARAPYAVSAVTGDALARSGETDLSDLANRVAGLTVTNLGSGRNKLFIRGLADGPLTGRTQSVVGIYLDDTRIIYNAPDPDLRLTDIERVELLRGPQGSLYGAGSIGGILQIVTNKPVLDLLEGFASTQTTLTEDGDSGEAVEAGFNVPIIEGHAALRVVGYRENSGGYVDDPAAGLRNVGGSLRQGLRASLGVRVNPKWQGRLTFVDQTIESDDTQYSEPPPGGYERALLLREPHSNDFDSLSALIEGDLGFARLRVSSAYQRHETTSRYDASLAAPLFVSFPTGPAPFDESSHIEAIVTEATLMGPGGGPLTWLGGVFISEYSQSAKSLLSAPALPVALYQESREDHVDEYAVYGEASWSITDRFRFTAGGRYYKLAVETRSLVETPTDGGVMLFEGTAPNHGFAPKVLAEFDLSDRVLLYVQAAEGYRAGGFNTAGLTGQAFSSEGNGPQPFRLFRSDDLTSYEAGARLSFLNGDLKVRAAAFRVQWNDIQSDRLLPSGLPFTANIGDGQNTGIEIEAAFRRGSVRLDADLFLNDPELTRPDPGFPLPDDRHLPGVASVIANLQAVHEWGLSGGRQATAGISLGYVGKSTLTFDSAIAPLMGGYVTSRAHGDIAGDRWRISANIDNLFGSSGDTFAFGNPFRLGERDQNTPQRPRTVTLALTGWF